MERAAGLLHALASQSAPVGLSELARSVGLAKGTAHGLIHTLVEVGFVEQNPATGRYALGPGLLQLGLDRLDPNVLRSRALNWTDALAARTGQAALVAVMAAGEAVVAHHVFRSDATAQTLLTATTLPLHASALGKVLLAYDPQAFRAMTAVALESLTYRTVTERSHLVRDLADLRDQGWAAVVEEAEPGVAEIAAPIRDKGGYVIAAIGIRGRVEAVCDGRLRPRTAMVEQVQRAGRSVSRELGHGRDL